MKKSFKFYLGAIFLALSLNVAACENFGKKDEIKQVYKMYVANGGTLTYEEWLETIKGPKGDKGDKGDTGETGVGIVSIVKTSSEGLVDTYTITYSDGTTSTFTVTNGEQGIQGIQGEIGPDGHTPIIRIGENGNWIVDDVDTGIPARGPQGEKGDTGKSAYEQYKETHPEYDKSEDEWLDDLLNGRLGNRDSHTVTFDTAGGSEIIPQTVYHGEKASKPDDPTKPGCTFEGWFYQNEPWVFYGYVITEDITLTAKWEYIDYTVTFVNDDGSELEKIEKVHYGDSVEYQGQIPSKVNVVDHYIYTFTGWNVDLSFIYGDTIAVAQYSEEYAPYTAYFLDENDNVLYFTLVAEGETASYQGEVPTKESTAEIQYQFSGWDEIERTEDTIKYKVRFESCTRGLIFDDGGVYQYVGDASEVTIPSIWNGQQISSLKAKCFEATNVKSVTLPDTIVLIGANAFNRCSKLVNANLNQGLNQIQTEAFSYCESLKNITMPNSLNIIGNSAFRNCSSLESINVPSGVDRISSYMLYKCSKLKNVMLNDGLEFIDYAAFAECSSLEQIALPNTIQTIGNYAFNSCWSLKSINTPTSLELLGDYTFNNCNEIKVLNLPSSIDYVGEYIVNNTCGTIITTDATYRPVSWNALFNNGAQVVWGFEKIETRNGISIAFGHTETQRIAMVTEIDDSVRDFRIDDYIDGYKLVSINRSAFWYNQNLRTVYLPSCMDVIPDNFFSSCVNLLYVDIPETVTSIGNFSFCDCYSLKCINFPENYTTVGSNAFTNCGNIDAIYLSRLDECLADVGLCSNSYVKIFCPESQEQAIALFGQYNPIVHCTEFNSQVQKVFFKESANNQYVLTDDNRIYGFKNINRDIVSYTFDDIPANITYLGLKEEAFRECKKLKRVVVPGIVESISNSCFGYCDELETVVLEEGVLYINQFAFNHCPKLINVSTPSSLTYVGQKVFNYSGTVGSYFVMPKVFMIDYWAFYGSEFKIFYLGSSYEDFQNNVEVDGNSGMSSMYIPSGLYFYKETEPTENYNMYWHYVDGVPTIWVPIS